jgi:hypothetical protein
MKSFAEPFSQASTALQIFEPDASTTYSIDAMASIAQVSRRYVVLYYRHGLLRPLTENPSDAGWYFNHRAIRDLRQPGSFHHRIRSHDSAEARCRCMLMNPIRAGLIDDPALLAI